MSGRHAVVNSLTFHLRRLAAVLFCATVLLGCALAEDGVTVPHLVKFSGTISGAPAGNVSVIFALYKDQSGGAPLWQEVQNLAVDSGGHYNSLLGLRSATGIPLEVFSTGEARWLGVEAEGQPEQPRVLLVSVPYALKASDSETLGGLPVSAFLRAGAAPVAAPAPANFINTAAVAAAVNNAVTAAISASGPTLGYVPYFYDASGDLKNSSLFQATSGNVGIGTTTPAAMFTIVGTNPSIRLENYSNVSGDSPNFNFYTGRGSANAPLATQSGDNLGQFASAGYTGSSFPGSKVKVTFLSTENWSPSANGTAMTFATTKNGTSTRAERMRIDNTGNVGIGTTTPAFPLSVAGIIQSTTGGFKFPDGTTQTTAASGSGGGGGVTSVTAGDSSITIAGSATAPTVAVASLGITDAKVHDVSVAKVTGAASIVASNTFTLPQTINVGTGAYTSALTVEDDNTGLSPNTIYAVSASGDTNANVIYAVATNTTSAASAIVGQTAGPGVPIAGVSTVGSGGVAGVEGIVYSTSGVGVLGYSAGATGSTVGVKGQVFSPAGYGLFGQSFNGLGYGLVAYGVGSTCNNSGCVPVAGGVGNAALLQAGVGGNLVVGQVVATSGTTTNVFRVDSTGKGFFNGGTATSGADFAESVDVEGEPSSYAPGDLMTVDPTRDRQFKQVSEPYSTLVAGIYATKPGILAMPHGTDDPRLASEIPLAMVGIVPCKVTAENGPIHRGDLLVSSSTVGHAMKGTDRNRMLGAVVGKALGSLEHGSGTIEVLVTLQ